MAAAAALAMLTGQAFAQTGAPVFAGIFGDHAVLQRGRPIPVWGHGAPGSTVTVTLDDRSTEAPVDAAGDWRAVLPAHAAGGPYTLSVATAGQATVLTDIAVGDVYLCGGQSNMEFPARQSTGAWGGFNDADNPDLRFVTIEKDSEAAAQHELKTPVAWHVAAPGTVGDASAVCYYMARSLQKQLQIPVGFIAADWGGTTIQSWISAPALGTLPAYRSGVAALSLYTTNPRQALADEARRVEAWWDQHDPNARAHRGWSLPDFDDGDWSTMTPRGNWRDAKLPALSSFNGVVWFRTTVTLTETQARSATDLQLGPIDTFDTAWINGIRVGGGTIAWVWRTYPIPVGTLKPGRNVIALRVLGGSNGGGLTGQPGVRGIKLANGDIVPLAPAWRYRTGSPITSLLSPSSSIAPSPWDVPTSLSTLYNGMIAPIAGYGIKLAAWYQGEANAGAPDDYADLLPLLMKDWRARFNQPDLPFLVVQLSSFGPAATAPTESGWSKLRDIQGKTVRADPHAGLAVTVDVGDRGDVHPTQKMVVGERLARAARAIAYGAPITPGGPEAVAVERRGADLIVRFRHVTGALRTYSAAVAIGFEACDKAACHFATGRPDGTSIVLEGANMPGVEKVRYAWADSSYVNLYDADDLPAVPFELTIDP